MSKGNYLLGQSTGKIGSIVTYVAGGEQRQRVHTKAGGRPGDRATLPARAQRVAFGGAANEWKLYRYICTRMFRSGKKTNESDYNYFTRINFENLPYLMKWENEAGFNVFMPGYYSRGNYGTINQVISMGVAGSGNYWSINSSQYNIQTGVLWTDPLKNLKNAYKNLFPSASKVTLLVGKYTEWTEEDPIEQAGSTDVAWAVITLMLSSEQVKGEDEKKISEYMTPKLQAIGITPNTNYDAELADGSVLLSIEASNVMPSQSEGIFLALFATNDNANDCYTTIMMSDEASNVNHPFNSWLITKTQSAMDAACESYGYQGQVMQSKIIEVGDRVKDIIRRDAELIAATNDVPADKINDYVNNATAAAMERNRSKLKSLMNVITEAQAKIDEAQAEIKNAASEPQDKKTKKTTGK